MDTFTLVDLGDAMIETKGRIHAPGLDLTLSRN
jgi:hypothetical protein